MPKLLLQADSSDAARLCCGNASDSSCVALQASQAAKAPRFATTPEGLDLIATQFHGQPLTSQRRVSNRRESWQSRQAIQSRALEFAAIQRAQAAAEQEHGLLDAISEPSPERLRPQPLPQQPPRLSLSSRGMNGPRDILDGPVNGNRQQQDMHRPHASASLPAASNPGDLDVHADLKRGPRPAACAPNGQSAAVPAAKLHSRLLVTTVALMTPPEAEPTQFLRGKQAGRSAGPRIATKQPVASAWGQPVASSSQPPPPPPRTTAPLLGPIPLKARSSDEVVAKALQVNDTLVLPSLRGSLISKSSTRVLELSAN